MFSLNAVILQNWFSIVLEYDCCTRIVFKDTGVLIIKFELSNYPITIIMMYSALLLEVHAH